MSSLSRLQIGLSLPGLRWLLAAALIGAAHPVAGQEGTGTGTGGGTSTGTGSSNPGGASSSFGAPAFSTPPSSVVPPSSTTTPGTTPGSPGTNAPGTTRDPASMLSDSPFTGTNSNAPSFRTGGTGAASSFGAGQTEGPTQMRQAPTTFSLPGFYGQGPKQFTVGEGRLARPRFRTTINVSEGYDDNVFQTPTNPVSVPSQEVQVLVRPGVSSSLQEVVVPSGDPAVPNETKMVEVPAQKAKFQTVRVPGVPAPERIGSWITKTDLGFDMQMANRRSLFTFDFNGGASYYWNRPGKKADYTATLALVYLYKLTGRAQFTAALNTSYQSQPDFSQPNLPTSNNKGNYIPLNAKADISYRLTPRISTVTSVSYNSLYYTEKTEQADNYTGTTFGTELRYLFSPRLTLLGELRYSSQTHSNDTALDTTTTFALAGAELALSRRFTSTLRIGEALQTFSQGGASQSAPYGEATLSYRLNRGTTLQWNGRYGYEVAGSPDSFVLVGRTGLSLSHIFTPRLQGSLTLNASRSVTTTTADLTVTETDTTTTLTNNTTGATATATDSTPTTNPKKARTKEVTTESVQETFEANLALQYILSRRWTMSLSYNYTMVIGPESTDDYYRQRVFLGAEYQF